MVTRSFADVRRLRESGGTGGNLNLTLPKEISQMLRRAGVQAVRVTTTSEGILLTPYREPEIPEWARRRTTTTSGSDSRSFECERCGDGDALRAGEACAYCGREWAQLAEDEEES